MYERTRGESTCANGLVRSDAQRARFFGRFKAKSSKASDGIRKAAAMMHVKKTGRSGSRSGSGRGPSARPFYEDNYQPKILAEYNATRNDWKSQQWAWSQGTLKSLGKDG